MGLNLGTLFLSGAVASSQYWNKSGNSNIGEHTFDARGVISTCIALPSSSLRGLKMAVVWRRLVEVVNLRFAGASCRIFASIFPQPWCKADTGMLGSRKSKTGMVLLCRYLRGVSWRNARAADDGADVFSCEQPFVMHLDAMVSNTEDP